MSSISGDAPPSIETSQSKKGYVALFGGVLVSALAMLGAASFHQSPPKDAPKVAGIDAGKDAVTLTPNAPQWQSLKLGEALPAKAGWTDTFPARFRVNEAKAARIGTPLAGRVTRVLVELGDPVKAGDPLFSIASSDVAALRSEQQRAQVELSVAKERYARVQAMVDARAVPGKDALESEAALRQSELGLRLADAKLASLKVSPRADNEFTVVAPCAGVVVEKKLLPSQQVSSDQSLIEIADMSSVWAVAEVFEADAIGIRAGTPATLSRSELAGLSFDGKVDMVSSVVDPQRHTVSVRVVVPNPDRQIRANTYVEMRFEQDPPAGTVEIGAAALVSNGAEKYVYVEEAPGRFVRRVVSAGSSVKGRVVITSGLRAGERVVEEGSALLDNQIALSN